jgi:peptidoglycan/LPS O-acetylase OafA/YrhL
MDAIALGCLTAITLSRLTIPRSALWISGAAGTASLVFVLGFSIQVEASVLGRSGLDMTLLALGTCLLIASAAQGRWRSPRIGVPLGTLGRRSYEVYLTHMFVVFALFRLFVAAGKPPGGVPILFVAVILAAGLLGEWVARAFSEPMNRRLRRRFSREPGSLGSAIDANAIDANKGRAGCSRQ